MSLKTILYLAALGALVGGAFYLSFSGSGLPTADAATGVSLRGVQNRRSQFVHHYAMGK